MKALFSTPSPVTCGLALLALAGSARAAITIPSDGSDGAFSPAANVTVDLTQAVTAAWNANNAANAGKGVYDADKWAVVFKYSSVNIPAGVTVTFKNHGSHAPVVWLVQGNVTIAGSVNLNGINSTATGLGTEAGPGGFRGGFGGGTAIPQSSGFGPGGGGNNRSASYSTQGYNSPASTVYGNPMILPLIGGSGGPGANSLNDGGSAAGAILIASGGTITLSGSITAHGGDGPSGGFGASGGAIRLVADSLTGTGALNATGGGYGGGDGRIRLEANTTTLGGPGDPVPSVVAPIGATPNIWPQATAPKIVVTQIGGINVPSDPRASFTTQDVSLASTAPVTVRLQATNVPSTWTVSVRLAPRSGWATLASATKVSGDDTSSIWEAQVTLPSGFAAIQAHAYKP